MMKEIKRWIEQADAEKVLEWIRKTL